LCTQQLVLVHKDMQHTAYCWLVEGVKCLCLLGAEVNVWVSVNNPDEIAKVNPSWYQDNGTPIDIEGDDMVYSHSYIIEG